MKKIILVLIIIFLNIGATSYAENTEQINNNIESTQLKNSEILNNIEYQKNISLGEDWSISLEDIEELLLKKYKNKILFEWDTRGESTKTGVKYKKTFDSFGEKKINLNIYELGQNKKELILTKDFDVYVYKTSLLFISQDEILKQMEEYVFQAKENGIFIHNIGPINIKDIEKYNFLEKINQYKQSLTKTSDYVIIWGNREFLFDVIANINTNIKKEKLNLVLISAFNMNILKNYLQNFISNKDWISHIILLNELPKSVLSNNSENIINLEEQIDKNGYDYTNISKKKKINSFLFISKFINDLSNKGFNTSNIYVILIIPFLLVGVSFFKHFIGLSPTGLLIPIAITLLSLKIGILITLAIILLFLATNLTLSKVVGKYKLHYTPKVTMLIIVNIVVFIIAINFINSREIINITINDIMFVILFILVSERLANIVVSKEFGEYKNTLLNTIIFSIVAYLFFSLSIVQTFLLAYPETILILIPISFLMGKFSGLRVSEYFRFKEVIKGIEE